MIKLFCYIVIFIQTKGYMKYHWQLFNVLD